MQDMEKIYQEYAQIVYKYIFCLTGKEDITEEIVQETFEVAIRNIHQFKGDCKISTWLCQIAKYRWYAKLRKEKKTKKVSFDKIENTVISETFFEEALEEKEQKLMLFKRIQKLDEPTRNVMYLRILGNLEYKEIAEIMNQTPSWARVMFFRGKQKLKEEENEKGM